MIVSNEGDALAATNHWPPSLLTRSSAGGGGGAPAVALAAQLLSQRASLFRRIARNSATCAVYGRTQAGFNYSLDGSLTWQGRWCTQGRWCEHGPALLIGDKRGGGTSQHLEPLGAEGGEARLRLLSWQTGLPLRVLHVVRDPFDMAATQWLTHTATGNWHLRLPANGSHAPFEPLSSCEVRHPTRCTL
jgi:hypothetical protein